MWTLILATQNDGPRLLPFLTALVEATEGEDYAVVIVDRGSTDETPAIFSALSGDLRTAHLPASATYEEAIAYGRSLVRTPRHRVISFETKAYPGWLAAPAFERPLLPQDVLGPATGVALDQVLTAVLDGADVGELPLDAAEILRERFALEDEYQLLRQARAGRDVCWLDEDEAEPLVTIRMATFNKAEELMEVAIPSVLAQTYDNLELVVVGDHTDEATIRAMASISDPRVRFFDLPRPSLYPEHPINRWRVGGSAPMNLGVDLARGAWIGPCDDDDELTDDHVEVLLREARARRLEFVWSKTAMETPQGWQTIGCEPLATGNATVGSILYSAGLRFMKMSTTSWKFAEPHDGNLFRRMNAIGVKSGFLDAVTYRYRMSTIFKVTGQVPSQVS